MYLAIDIGGTKTALASFRDLDPQYQVNEAVIPTDQNYNQALENLTTQIHKLSENQPITAIGISVAARITDQHTIGLQANIPDYVGHDPAADLNNIFNTAVHMHNDAACAALAEAMYGRGQSAQRLLHIIMGTGTGGAFIYKDGDKRVVIPLEPGHVITESGKTWGGYISSKHLEEQLKTPLETVADTHPIWKDVTRYLSLGLYNLSVLLNPQVITFSGGLIQKRQFLLDGAATLLAEYKDTLPTPPQLVLSTLSDNPCLLGALALCR